MFNVVRVFRFFKVYAQLILLSTNRGNQSLLKNRIFLLEQQNIVLFFNDFILYILNFF